MTKQAKIKSGAVLVGIGFGLNLIGRALSALFSTGESVLTADIEALVMVASVVVFLLGLFRLIWGALSRTQ